MDKGFEIDPGMDARAQECLRLYLAGDLEPSELIFSRPPPADEVSLRGKIRELNDLGITTYRYNVCFRNAGQLEYHFGINSDGKVNQFSIMPTPGRAGSLKQYFKEGLTTPGGRG